MSGIDSGLDKDSDFMCDYCRARLRHNQSTPINYLPVWKAKKWETAKSSWKKAPVYGAYTIGVRWPEWSSALHTRGLVLDSSDLADIFRYGLYPFYVHMILLNEVLQPSMVMASVRFSDDTTYYPTGNKKMRIRYEQFAIDTLNFLGGYYEELLEPLGVIYERWKIVEEFQKDFVPEIMFLKDSVQTLIGAILRFLIREYFVCIRGGKISGPSPDPHMHNFCLIKKLGLGQPKKRAMYDFLENHKKFLQSPFPQNNLDNKHYWTFTKELQPELNKIMNL